METYVEELKLKLVRCTPDSRGRLWMDADDLGNVKAIMVRMADCPRAGFGKPTMKARLDEDGWMISMTYHRRTGDAQESFPSEVMDRQEFRRPIFEQLIARAEALESNETPVVERQEHSPHDLVLHHLAANPHLVLSNAAESKRLETPDDSNIPPPPKKLSSVKRIVGMVTAVGNGICVVDNRWVVTGLAKIPVLDDRVEISGEFTACKAEQFKALDATTVRFSIVTQMGIELEAALKRPRFSESPGSRGW